MSYEVDVLAVGKESKSGDAIAFRYGDFRDRSLYRVVVVDGGFEENGNQLVELIRRDHRTSRVDLVISTHPDADHSSGLKIVLDELVVGELWMHQPWNHTREANAYRGRPLKRFDEQLEESLGTANELESMAQRKGIPIREPFAGTLSVDGKLIVLGPGEDYYNELVAQFEEPAMAQARSIREQVRRFLREAAVRIRERWDTDALAEPDADATRPQNNSSAIVLAVLDEDVFIFTGDAGVPALDRAISPQIAAQVRSQLKYFQLPHHGSKRNVGPMILDRILGPRAARGVSTNINAFISAAKDGEPKHPSKQVTNAAIRRGARVFATQGQNHLYKSTDIPMREGYSLLTPIAFTDDYDEE